MYEQDSLVIREPLKDRKFLFLCRISSPDASSYMPLDHDVRRGISRRYF